MVDCVVQYDLLERGYDQWLVSLLGVLLFFCCLFGIKLRRALVQKPMPPVMKFTMKIGMIAALAWTPGMLAWTYFMYADLASSYRAGDYREVAGAVQGFNKTVPPERQKHNERFQVGNIEFSYSESSLEPGFHQIRAAGGPIHEGLLVRIRYIGDKIVRLESCSGAAVPGGDN